MADKLGHHSDNLLQLTVLVYPFGVFQATHLVCVDKVVNENGIDNASEQFSLTRFVLSAIDATTSQLVACHKACQ